MHGLTFADKMLEGVAVSIMGFLIVFIVLLVIMGILSIFNVINKAKQTQPAVTEEVKAAPPQPVPVPPQNLVDDKQLVAVITAAIMASRESSNEGTDGLVVRSIRRVNTWNKEALSEQANTFQ